MHRTDGDSNVANLFVDPGLGVTATQVDAAILNAFQEELCNLVELFGGTLVKGTNNQVAGVVCSLNTAQMLGGLKMFLAGLVATQSIADQPAIDATGNGVAPGIMALGGTDGVDPEESAGVRATGGVGTFGAGVLGFGGSAGGPGGSFAGWVNGAGVVALGAGAGAGVSVTAGATGIGAVISGGPTSGTGATIAGGGGNSKGVVAEGKGTQEAGNFFCEVGGTGGGVRAVGGNAGGGSGVYAEGGGVGGIGVDASGGTHGYGLRVSAGDPSGGASARAALRIVPQSADPAVASQGDIYVNSGDGTVRVYNGSAWVKIGTQT